MNRFLLISIGAVLGANARYLVGLWAAGRFGSNFPYGTLIINVTGSLILGFLITALGGRLPLSSDLRFLVGVGFCGAYTTFSSYTVETLTLAQVSGPQGAIINIAANNLVGLAAAFAGAVLARWIG